MRLHSTVLVALSAFYLFTAANGISAVRAQQLTPSNGELSTAEKYHDEKRSLRAEKIDEDDEQATEREERVSPVSLIFDLFTPKTAEQIAEAAKKAKAVEFYTKLAKSPSFRAERFPSWKTDWMQVESVLVHLKLWGLDGDEFKAIATKYAEFLKTGKLS
ncbi:hypothetical protein P3T76_004235 [Phytophthora citrophthora]|uniref:RxLR effector protein n=1 Tax=Phytophthora citrophthora TaxID=4793 RepID=A0AAD9GU68_9STRA|nr:hypothetical protein P3T76_004235 [Phytophthora citrophthora]